MIMDLQQKDMKKDSCPSVHDNELIGSESFANPSFLIIDMLLCVKYYHFGVGCEFFQ